MNLNMNKSIVKPAARIYIKSVKPGMVPKKIEKTMLLPAFQNGLWFGLP